jgi:hypothetical protein
MFDNCPSDGPVRDFVVSYPAAMTGVAIAGRIH